MKTQRRTNRPSKDGSINKSCLSQWYAALFVVDGLEYPTAEHWMMADKARLFGDEAAVAEILAAPDLKSAKALGRKVGNFDDCVWSERCRDIVTRGNVEKFRQNRLATGDAVIVEASPYDRVWGIGLKQEDERARDPARWRGENLLGFVLMEVRAGLKGA